MAMKTAISLPDELFLLADQLAKELGISRSELYATAIRSFISAQQRSDLTDRINAACAEFETRLPNDLAEAARRTLLEAEW
jgi:metal-responsive CopG/Arc/MetJ family transcriptional regulator